jgi:hypothetical protein
VIGNPHWPWQPIGDRDAVDVIEAIRAKEPAMMALSVHDSTDRNRISSVQLPELVRALVTTTENGQGRPRPPQLIGREMTSGIHFRRQRARCLLA